MSEDIPNSQMGFDAEMAHAEIAQYANMLERDIIGTKPAGYASPEAIRAGVDPGTVNITRKTAIEHLGEMSELQREDLALDMFINVTGAYGSFNDIFNDDGTLNMDTFVVAWETTFARAMAAGPQGLNLKTQYVDILMQEEETSDLEIQSLLQVAETKHLNQQGDAAYFADVLGSSLGQLLGRRPNELDERKFMDFLSTVFKDRPQLPVNLAAEEFVKTEYSEEYGAMDERRRMRGFMDAIRTA